MEISYQCHTLFYKTKFHVTFVPFSFRLCVCVSKCVRAGYVRMYVCAYACLRVGTPHTFQFYIFKVITIILQLSGNHLLYYYLRIEYKNRYFLNVFIIHSTIRYNSMAHVPCCAHKLQRRSNEKRVTNALGVFLILVLHERV